MSADFPRVNGVVRLKRDASSPLGVSAATWQDADVTKPEDLPEHRVELHVFGSKAAANGFREGVEASGSQSIAVSPPCGPGSLAVLLARFAEERPEGDDLDEAVPLVFHGTPGPVQEAVRLDEASDRRASVALAAARAWAPVGEALAGLPAQRPRHPGEFVWRMAVLEPLTDGRAVIAGTMDPDPAVVVPMQHEFRAGIVRTDDGRITVSLDPLEAGIRCTREVARWRAPEMEAVCARHGWSTIEGRPFAPIWTGDEGDAGGLRQALRRIPEMARELSDLAKICNEVDRALVISRDHGLADVLRILVENPEARIRIPANGSRAWIDTSREGRKVSNSVIDQLLRLGFVDQQPRVETDEHFPLSLSERGRLAAERQAELLADAMRRDEALDMPVDGPRGPSS